MDEIQYVDLKIKRGDSKTWTLYFSVKKTGEIISISGWTVFFTVKEKITDTDDMAKIKKDITSHTDPSAGKSQISLTSSDTSITPKNYLYDIQILKNTGEIKTILEGGFIVTQDITQRS